MGCLAALWQDWCLREPAARMLSTILSEYPSHPPKYRWRALRSGGIGVPTTCRLAVLMLLLLLLPLHVFRGAFITRAVAAFAIKPLSYARVRFQQAALSSLGHRTCSLSLHFLFFFFVARAHYLFSFLRAAANRNTGEIFCDTCTGGKSNFAVQAREFKGNGGCVDSLFALSLQLFLLFGQCARFRRGLTRGKLADVGTVSADVDGE